MGFWELLTGDKKLNSKKDAKKSEEQGSIVDRINLADDTKKLEIFTNPENKKRLIRDLNSKVEGDVTLKDKFENLTQDLISKEKSKFSQDNLKNKITLNSSDLKNIQSILTMTNVFDKKDDGSKSSDYKFFQDLIRIIENKSNYKNEYVTIDLPDGWKQKFLLTQENGNIVLNNKIEKISNITLWDHPKDFLFSVDYIGTGYDVVIKDNTSREKRIHLWEKDLKNGLVELGNPSLVYGWKLENDTVSFKSLSLWSIKEYTKKPSDKEEDKQYIAGYEATQPLTEATVAGKIDWAIKSWNIEEISKYINNTDKKIQQAWANSLNTLLNQTLNNFNAGKFDLAGIAQVFTELFKNSWFKSFLDEWSNIFWTENTISKNIANLEQGLSDNELNKSFEKNDPKLDTRKKILESYETTKQEINKIYTSTDLPIGKTLKTKTWNLEIKLTNNNKENGIKVWSEIQIWTDPKSIWKIKKFDWNNPVAEKVIEKNWKNIGGDQKIDWIKYIYKKGEPKEYYNLDMQQFEATQQQEKLESKQKDYNKNIDGQKFDETISSIMKNIDLEAYKKTVEKNVSDEKSPIKETLKADANLEKSLISIKSAIVAWLKISSEKDFLNALTTLLLTDKLGKYYPTVTQQPVASK